jgi:hypothetical protein
LRKSVIVSFTFTFLLKILSHFGRKPNKFFSLNILKILQLRHARNSTKNVRTSGRLIYRFIILSKFSSSSTRRINIFQMFINVRIIHLTGKHINILSIVLFFYTRIKHHTRMKLRTDSRPIITYRIIKFIILNRNKCHFRNILRIISQCYKITILTIPFFIITQISFRIRTRNQTVRTNTALNINRFTCILIFYYARMLTSIKKISNLIAHIFRLFNWGEYFYF